MALSSTMRYASKVTRRYQGQQARERSAQIESARQGIPVNAYLKMLHHAACTGEMPHYDPDTGKLTGTSDHVAPKERLDVIQYLVDKALPDLQRAPAALEDTLSEHDLDNLAPKDVANMTTDQLKALVVAGKNIHDAAFTRPATDPR